jgi:AcrR family transcriptional regulator
MVAAQRLEGAALFDHPISAAVVAVVRERGYERASVEEFCRYAGIGREEFERNFSDKAEATVRVFEAYIADFKARVGAAYRISGPWPGSLRAAAYEVIRWMREHPDAPWFGMVGMLEAGEMALVRREEVFKWCAELIDGGREVTADPAGIPTAAPLLAVGAVVETLRRQEEGSIEKAPVEAVPKLMYGAVRPYLGEAAARAELEIPPPADLAELPGGEGGRL